ncbi:SAM-dependent methyltransferase [Streptomyces sp. AP-93]|uniref:SAM-dependent methyltransferase n=1 Tax=Streptomyces sp. AP-93 TaxID=2929048 RepID=UPI001FAF9810|nr:SAM-dependent methyltransferase [Streptomyces sp. AP-93]MCJ0874603.1 SAM-dependent methyltransferase [Streptomyces sp. AP-93]
MDPVEVVPVGVVVGGRSAVVDDDWGRETAVIRLDPEQFGPQALYGLEDFSHVEVVFHFDRVPEDKIETGARRPRGNRDWPLVGIFAQRGKNRPNRLGLSRCRVLKVDVLAADGPELHVEGLDAVAGTPVLDLKPYMTEFGPRGDHRQPEWATELMRDYY